MLTSWMTGLIEHQRLGFVATVSGDGTPNLSPKGTFVVVDERTLAFGDIRSPNTIRNIAQRPDVEINFVDPLARRGVRIRGAAIAYARGTPQHERLLPRFAAWPTLLDRIRHVVLVDLRLAVEITSPAYDVGATEQELREYWKAALLKAEESCA